jgi:hypothetical protein
MAVQIKIRRATSSQWSTANPILLEGEIVVETDTRQVKIGDGTTAYNSLTYGFDAGTVWTVNPFFMV